MITLAKTKQGTSIDSEQGRHRVGLIQAIEIDEEAHDPIGESMPDRFQTGMHDVAAIERRRLLWRSR